MLNGWLYNNRPDVPVGREDTHIPAPAEETTTETKVWLTPTADELGMLEQVGLQPRDNVPGLFLCRADHAEPIVSGDPIMVPLKDLMEVLREDDSLMKLANRMRDQLATLLREEGTGIMPRTYHNLEKRADLMGAWLQGADLSKAKLQGGSLIGAQLQKANLSGAQLQGANLSGAQLQGANLGGAQLERASLYEAQLEDANLSKANLQEANLIGAQLKKANLSVAHLQRAGLGEAQLEEADLSEAQLQDANLGKANLQEAILRRAQLQGADLRGAQLQKANLRGAQLQKADLSKAQLQGSDLLEAQLQDANLRKAQLQGAGLRGAQLQGADFRGAQLERANFSEAQLKDANFTETQLQGASFVRAKLAGANLTQAKLAGADFTSADLTKANLNQALETMRNYRPPHPPAALASGPWRSKSVAKATAVAVYKRVVQELDDDDNDDDDDKDDSDGSEDEGDSNDDAKLAPWLEAADEVATQAAGALVAVAQPVLLLVSSMVEELGQFCDALAKLVPEALVRSFVPLLKEKPALPAAQLQRSVATRLSLLLKTCVLDLIFEEALPRAIRALEKQIKNVQLWVKSELPAGANLCPQAMAKKLHNELCTLTADLCEQQQRLLEEFVEKFAKDLPTSVFTRAKVSATPTLAPPTGALAAQVCPTLPLTPDPYP